MNLHEYQAKQILREQGVNTPRGVVVENAAHAELAASGYLGGDSWVIKAQVHAGGRGKAGGVRIANSLAAVVGISDQLLGSRLITAQNAPQGQLVGQLLLEETLDIAREMYVSFLLDRDRERVILVASASGGMEIEAMGYDREIAQEVCDPVLGLQAFQCRSVAFALGLGEQATGVTRLLQTLYRIFTERDLSLLEINPLALTRDGRLIALDCKMVVDDNALARQPQLADWADDTQSDDKEVAAHAAGLNYIALDGDIGCLVNGAGLAMATMDLIRLNGGKAANFLDVGGGATAATVARALGIILSDEAVKAILVNIFGGIMRCDTIAEGIITAIREVGVRVPVIVRLEGTNVELGKAMLRDSGLDVVAAEDLSDAARRAVALASGVPA